MVIVASNSFPFIGVSVSVIGRRRIPVFFNAVVSSSQRRDLNAEFLDELPAFTRYLLSIDSDIPLGSNGLYDAYVESIVRFNLGHQAYLENLKYLLSKDEHRCTEVEPLNITDEQIREIRDKAYSEEISAIVDSEAPTDAELEALNNAVAKTKAERYKERKGKLIKTYGDCTEEIVKADDDGCFKPLQLFYYMTVGRIYL